MGGAGGWIEGVDMFTCADLGVKEETLVKFSVPAERAFPIRVF
jgi:hypothetical protein